MKEALNKVKLNKDEKIEPTKHKYLKGVIYGLIGSFAFLGFLSVINNPANNPLNYISTEKSISTAVPKPINQLDKCIQEAEIRFKTDYKNRIGGGYDLLNANEAEEYRKKMLDLGKDPARIGGFISSEKETYMKINDDLHQRMIEEKELCGKLYNK